jgi:hypothetical protein
MWDSDHKEFLRSEECTVSAYGFLSICGYANATIVSLCWSLCLIVAGKKSQSTLDLVDSRWV